jgi:hypothetical protein
VLALVFVSVVAATARGAGPSGPTILMIGDSVGTGISWHRDAIAVMSKNVQDIEWDITICRRTVGESCDPGDGEAVPPNVVDLVNSLPSVPSTVVVEMGYNDYLDTFAGAVDQTMEALLSKGAQHVLWLNLREAEEPFPELNAILEAKAQEYPQLQILDWNALSAPHPEWFQTDHVHLLDAGGVAMAHLVHGSVMALYAPLHVVGTLPPVRAGHPYAAKLQAAGGTAPYTWKVTAGRPPNGIRLLPNGRILGAPRQNVPMNFAVTVTDSDGLTAQQQIQTAG